jgi:ribosomal protein S6--L-glutamate ligase
MNIGVISTQEKAGRSGSVMQQAADLLTARGHVVEMIYPDAQCNDVATIQNTHDLYLLKAGTETALAYAGLLHGLGARILNPYPTVVLMKDKILSTQVLQRAGVPLPATFFAGKAEQLAGLLADGPLVVKPFWGASQGRGVQMVHSERDLESLTTTDLFFAQRLHKPDGRDYKLYVIGEKVFGVRRVWPPVTLEDKLGEAFDVSDEMKEICFACGKAFGIDLFGLDIITSDGKPYVVDINTFPGFKGVPDAAELLATYLQDYTGVR